MGFVICPRCHYRYALREAPDNPRTTGPRSQSACLNGWIQVICHETGDDFDDMKVRVKAHAVKHGFPPPHEIAAGDEIYRVFKSEARCTVSEIMAMIEAVKEIAAFTGVILPEYPKEEGHGPA